jgi:uncharacterized membrane protein YccC
MGESWDEFSKALERDSQYTNDPVAEGYPGQAKGTKYIFEEVPAMLAGVTAALAFCACGALVKLLFLARAVLLSRRAGVDMIPK